MSCPSRESNLPGDRADRTRRNLPGEWQNLFADGAAAKTAAPMSYPPNPIVIPMSRIQVISSVFLCFVLANAGVSFSQEATKPSEESARYLKQLTEATERIEKMVAQLREQGRGDQADRMASGELVRYKTGLKQSQESVAKGNEFGRTEYLAVINGIAEAAKNDYKRAIIESNQIAETAMRENNRQYELTVAAALKKHQDAISKSDETFRQQTEAINLKSRFNASRGRIGMVIWNLPPDQELHKRLTTAVTIELLYGSEVVWTRKNVKLNRKLPNNPIRLPNVIFDSVSVEILKWTGSGGGLAEIEVFLGESNVAKFRPCEVSSIETLPIHLDDQNSLTDGVTRPTTLGNGYWIPEGDAKATVTVQLLGKKLQSESTSKR